MKAFYVLLIITLVMTFTPGINAAAEDAAVKVEKAQTHCPVMGGEINKAAYVDVLGKRIYVCCAGCISKIKADPKKYIKKLEDDGVKLEAAPKPKKAKDDHAGHDHSGHNH